MRTLAKFIADHSLSIAFILLFIACILGQSFSGLSLYNQVQSAHGLQPIGYWRFLGTGMFLQGVFSNWQAALLQLGSLIIFGVYLRQRGAPHSRKPGTSQNTHSKSLWRGKKRDWPRRNSLSLAFFALFLLAFLLHLLSGAADYNQQRAFSHEAPLSIAAFFVSAKFWFATFQTWQAEYMAIAVYILLSVFLRQEGSPESKPVGASNASTGETNK